MSAPRSNFLPSLSTSYFISPNSERDSYKTGRLKLTLTVNRSSNMMFVSAILMLCSGFAGRGQ